MNSQDVEHTKTEMKNNVIDFIEELIKSLTDSVRAVYTFEWRAILS